MGSGVMGGERSYAWLRLVLRDGIYAANVMDLSALLCCVGRQRLPHKSLYA